MSPDRDFEIIEWLSRIGAATANHVTERLAMNGTQACARLSRLALDGLLDDRRLLYGQPALYIATDAGLRMCGLEALGTYRFNSGGFAHARHVASAAIAVHRSFPEMQVLSEREIRVLELELGRPIASVALGELGDGDVHRPNLAAIALDGLATAIEVELFVRPSQRLVALCAGWMRARHVDAVYYLAPAAAARALAHAIRRAHAEERVFIVGLSPRSCEQPSASWQ